MPKPRILLDEKIEQCPYIAGWCNFKGEAYFALLNYESSLKQNRVMLDLSYCATKALNNIVLKTVPYSQANFEPVEWAE